MKSITLHNLDSRTVALIEKLAKEKGKSLNKTIKELLQQALGITKSELGGEKNDFDEFFGVWDQKDLEEFNNGTEDFEKVDKNDWE